MRKRTDRAAAVKHVDRERLLGAKERLILGCDAAREVWYGAWMNEQSEVLQTIRWDLVEDTTAVVALVEQLRETVAVKRLDLRYGRLAAPPPVEGSPCGPGSGSSSAKRRNTFSVMRETVLS